MIKYNIDKFIEKALVKHGDKYDYSLVDYKNNKTKINIKCPIHGVFEQEVGSHLRGVGCGKCYGLGKTTDELVNCLSVIHGDKYDYSLVKYKNAHTKIIIRCPIHGEFKQTPNHHLKGRGCPICRESKGEKEVRKYLINNNIRFESQKTFNDCKDIRLLPFDFYLPDYNICIEYDGRQHFEPIKRWGGSDGLIDQERKDEIKNIYCDNKNINLIRISYKEDILNELINRLIFINKKETCHIL